MNDDLMNSTGEAGHALGDPALPADSAYGESVQLLVQLDIQGERITSIIAPGMKITGNLDGSEGLMVCGEVVGDITVEDGPDDTGTIVIHEGGMVRGTVSGRRIVVLGTVDGDVISSTHLTLGERGRITQNTYYRRILTADGGELEGYVRRIKEGMDPRKDLLARRSNGKLAVP